MFRYFALRGGGGIYARSARDARTAIKRSLGSRTVAFGSRRLAVYDLRGLRQVGFTAMRDNGMV